MTATDAPPTWMRQSEVAEYLRVAEHTLENWRYLRTGPRFTKAGGRVLYRRSDLDTWLEANAQGGDVG